MGQMEVTDARPVQQTEPREKAEQTNKQYNDTHLYTKIVLTSEIILPRSESLRLASIVDRVIRSLDSEIN